jgi:hypothetical protein
VATYNSCARTRTGATGVAQAWEDAHAAMSTLQRLSHAFEEALGSLQLATECSAEASRGYSSCLAVIARLLHKEAEEVRWLTLSLLDDRSRKIVQFLLSTMDGPAELPFDGPGVRALEVAAVAQVRDNPRRSR